VEGTERAIPIENSRPTVQQVPTVPLAVPATSDKVQILLANSFPLPDLTYETFEGAHRRVPLSGQRPLLINLWASWCRPCLVELSTFEQDADRLLGAVDVLALSVDEIDEIDEYSASKQDAKALLKKLGPSFPGGVATPEMLEKLQLVHNHLLDVHRPMPVPTSFLLQPGKGLAAIYKGPVDVEWILRDVELIEGNRKDRRTAALPLPGRWLAAQRPVHLLPFAWTLVKSGYVEEGLTFIERNLPKFAGDREYAKMLALTGYHLLEQKKFARAAEQYRKSIAVDPKGIVARLNLAVALIRVEKYDLALAEYRQVLLDNPNEPKVYYTLAWLLATAPDPAVRDGVEAVRLAERVVRMSGREDALMLEVLAAAYAEAGKFDQAVSTARKALGLLKQKNGPNGGEHIQKQLTHYLRGKPFRDRTR